MRIKPGPAIYSLLAFVQILSGCTSQLLANPIETPSQSPRDLTDFFASVKTVGSAAVCKRQSVEIALAVRLTQFKARRTLEGFDTNESQVEAINAGAPIVNGKYERFRSSTTSMCVVSVTLRPGAFCIAHLKEYEQRVGQRLIPHVQPHPTAESERTNTYVHYFDADDRGNRNEIWLKVPKFEACATSAIVRTYGTWSALE